MENKNKKELHRVLTDERRKILNHPSNKEKYADYILNQVRYLENIRRLEGYK